MHTMWQGYERQNGQTLQMNGHYKEYKKLVERAIRLHNRGWTVEDILNVVIE